MLTKSSRSLTGNLGREYLQVIISNIISESLNPSHSLKPSSINCEAHSLRSFKTMISSSKYTSHLSRGFDTASDNSSSSFQSTVTSAGTASRRRTSKAVPKFPNPRPDIHRSLRIAYPRQGYLRDRKRSTARLLNYLDRSSASSDKTRPRV